jgi:hypothetical protein
MQRALLMGVVLFILGLLSFGLSLLNPDLLSIINSDSQGFIFIGCIFIAMSTFLFIGYSRQKS